MRVLNRITTDRVHPIIKGWPVKLLSTVVLACMATSAGHTSDREIYQAAQGGNASILMMLDNSISMNNDSILEDYPDIRFRFSGSDEIRERFYNDDGTDIGYIPYSVEYYTPSRNGDKYYSRISRLKMALIPLFANPKSSSGFGADIDLTKYKIGLGSFFGGARQGGGQVDAPISDLTQANRISLIYKIAGLTPSTYTPIANAYAAAGAYMLKGNTSYSSPMPTTPAQCDGYGVYFLTDGEPNSVYSENTTRNLMNTSLSGSSLSVSSISTPKLPSARTYYASGVDAPTGAYVGTPGWELIGQYAKALNSDNNFKKDAIATATVGFGSVYKELYDRRTTIGGKDTYNCNDPSVESQDAKNLCNFGKKGQGFGEGGFYYTAESDDIAKSVKSFIKGWCSKKYAGDRSQ